VTSRPYCSDRERREKKANGEGSRGGKRTSSYVSMMEKRRATRSCNKTGLIPTRREKGGGKELIFYDGRKGAGFSADSFCGKEVLHRGGVIYSKIGTLKKKKKKGGRGIRFIIGGGGKGRGGGGSYFTEDKGGEPENQRGGRRERALLPEKEPSTPRKHQKEKKEASVFLKGTAFSMENSPKRGEGKEGKKKGPSLHY